jgi:hypothetical protein
VDRGRGGDTQGVALASACGHPLIERRPFDGLQLGGAEEVSDLARYVEGDGRLLTALKAGHSYSSTGPQLLGISLTYDHIAVRCSPVRKILITGGAPGGTGRAGQGPDGLHPATGHVAQRILPGYARTTPADAPGAHRGRRRSMTSAASHPPDEGNP